MYITSVDYTDMQNIIKAISSYYVLFIIIYRTKYEMLLTFTVSLIILLMISHKAALSGTDETVLSWQFFFIDVELFIDKKKK
jgi:hypothetical protein